MKTHSGKYMSLGNGATCTTIANHIGYYEIKRGQTRGDRRRYGLRIMGQTFSGPKRTIHRNHDNTSIGLNGKHQIAKTSSSDVRYFFIMEKIQKEKSTGLLSKTDKLSDFFIKPRHGAVFSKMQ